MKIRIVLVDDEPLARQRMKDLLAVHEDIEIIAECATGQRARATIEQLKAQVAMTGHSGRHDTADVSRRSPA